MLHSTSTSTSLLHHNNRFLFSFNSITSHSHSHSLSFNKSLSPLSPSSSSSSSTVPSPSPCCRVARVSTEALELSPPPPGCNFGSEIVRLAALRDKLAACAALDDRLRVLDADSRVRQFFRCHRSSGFGTVLESLRLGFGELFLLKCLVAAGQEHVLCLGEAEIEAPAAAADASSSVKSALYALVQMIESLDSCGGNGGAGFGKSGGMALDDEEIRNLNTLLKTLGEIERFYDCIGGIIGCVIIII